MPSDKPETTLATSKPAESAVPADTVGPVNPNNPAGDTRLATQSPAPVHMAHDSSSVSSPGKLEVNTAEDSQETGEAEERAVCLLVVMTFAKVSHYLTSKQKVIADIAMYKKELQDVNANIERAQLQIARDEEKTKQFQDAIEQLDSLQTNFQHHHDAIHEPHFAPLLLGYQLHNMMKEMEDIFRERAAEKLAEEKAQEKVVKDEEDREMEVKEDREMEVDEAAGSTGQ